ncbi:IS110 family transposase [Mycobacterium canettii]|uniref:IS110 family transposase n=1 Tax=Mycobacterium canetti TaxID=78331 RepID=UPI001E5B78A6
MGDCRARFPTPESLACLAGVAPSPRQSGKVTHRRVPLGRRQTTPRRRLRLRRRQPPRPTPGPPTFTTAPEPAATTTLTPYASSPAPGFTSSGTAGKTASLTIPPNTEPCRLSVTKFAKRRLDTGLLMTTPPRAPARLG